MAEGMGRKLLIFFEAHERPQPGPDSIKGITGKRKNPAARMTQDEGVQPGAHTPRHRHTTMAPIFRLPDMHEA